MRSGGCERDGEAGWEERYGEGGDEGDEEGKKSRIGIKPQQLSTENEENKKDKNEEEQEGWEEEPLIYLQTQNTTKERIGKERGRADQNQKQHQKQPQKKIAARRS